MKFTEQTVKRISELAKLNLTENEEEKAIIEMKKILLFMEKLDDLDTSNVKPMEQVIDIKNVFREDRVEKSLDRDKLLENAISKEDGCFKVPKVVE